MIHVTSVQGIIFPSIICKKTPPPQKPCQHEINNIIRNKCLDRCLHTYLHCSFCQWGNLGEWRGGNICKGFFLQIQQIPRGGSRVLLVTARICSAHQSLRRWSHRTLITWPIPCPQVPFSTPFSSNWFLSAKEQRKALSQSFCNQMNACKLFFEVSETLMPALRLWKPCQQVKYLFGV